MAEVFFTRINGRFQSIPFKDVLYVVARKNYSEICTIYKRKICIYTLLSHIESRLPDNLFCRIHRSYIIAIQRIDSFDRNHVYAGEETFPISKQYFDELTKRVVMVAYDHETKNKK